MFYFLPRVNICVYIKEDQQTGKLVAEAEAYKEQSDWMTDTVTASPENLFIDLRSHLENTEISVS